MLYLDEQTKNHSVHAAACGLVGAAPQGFGADLRRKGQRSCGMQRDAERRGRNGPDGQLVAGAVRLLEPGEYRIPLDELPCRAARRPLLVLRILVGHFLGQHLTYADYDLGSRTKRYKGNAYGLGVSYGYAWMLSKRWNIALEAGIGLFHTEDTRRDPTVSDWEDEYIYRYRRWTLAPTKLEVSFSYIF